MKKRLLLFVFLFVFVLITFIIIFVLSAKDEFEYNNINSTKNIYLDIQDKDTHEQLLGTYSFGNNLTGTVNNKDSIEQISIPLSGYSSIYVQSPGYYSEYIQFTDKRIKASLTKIGVMNISYDGFLNSEKGSITLKISTDSVNKHLYSCVAWSQSIINIDMFPYVEINSSNILPHDFKDRIDKCFKLRKDVKKDFPLEIILHYTAYNTIGDRDFINAYFIDSDIDNTGKFITINSTGGDVGGKNVKLTIK